MYLLAALFRQIARLRELYEADFHKLGIYGSVRVWANAWDVVSRTPSRGGRGRRDAMDFMVRFGWGGFFCFLFFFRFFFSSSNTHGVLQVGGRLASFISLLVPGAYRVPLFSLSVCMYSFCLSACLSV